MGDGDAALAAAWLSTCLDLWPHQSQQTIRRQGAGNCGFVNIGGEAVAAVELARDESVVILRKKKD